jgi:FkbM family methyltransferase
MKSSIPTEYYLPNPNWGMLISTASPVILDIGANDGGTSASFLRLFPGGKVYAFEPDPRALSRFKSRIAVGQIDSKNCVLFEGAVSCASGFLPFYQSQGTNPNLQWYETGWDLSGSLKRPLNSALPDVPSITFESTIQVPVTSLDEWAVDKHIRRIDLMWIDVQGAELDVLKGATKLLSQTEFIFLECGEQMAYEGQATLQQLVEQLSRHTLIHKYPNDALFRLSA